eukprot:106579_1
MTHNQEHLNKLFGPPKKKKRKITNSPRAHSSPLKKKNRPKTTHNDNSHNKNKKTNNSPQRRRSASIQSSEQREAIQSNRPQSTPKISKNSKRSKRNGWISYKDKELLNAQLLKFVQCANDESKDHVTYWTGKQTRFNNFEIQVLAEALDQLSHTKSKGKYFTLFQSMVKRGEFAQHGITQIEEKDMDWIGKQMKIVSRLWQEANPQNG